MKNIICTLSVLFAATLSATAATPFEIVVMGDTQCYFNTMNDGDPNIFIVQTEWLRDNVKAHNIAFVTHVGDVTQGRGGEWAKADKYMKALDGAVPYSVTFGNHDSGAPGPFNAARYKDYPWYLGSSQDQLAHAQKFKAGDFTLLHINLPHVCNEGQRKWAAGIIEANPGLPTIITTHGYMTDNGWGRAGSGQNIWRDLVEPFPQVFMTCNGHDWVTRHELDTTQDGRVILQLQVNWQHIINGGNGLMQFLRFLPDAGRIDVRTYSPFIQTEHTDYTGRFSVSATLDVRKNNIRIGKELGPERPTWSGKGADGHLRTAANWTGTPAKAGDLLMFPNSPRKQVVNDFPAGTKFPGIVFHPGRFSDGYAFTGNALTLAGAIVNMGGYGPKNKPGAGPSFDLPLILEGDCQINPGDWDMTIAGVISGSGSLTKTHGRNYIRGSYDGGVYRGDLILKTINTYSGATRVTGGALILENETEQNLIPRSPRVELFYNTVLQVKGLKDETFAVAPGQTLSGDGKVMGNLLAAKDSIIEPGHGAAGALSFLNDFHLNENARLRLRLGGTGAEANAHLRVHGDVQLGGILDLAGLEGYSPKIGDQLLLIRKEGGPPVRGVFRSGKGMQLPEGTLLEERSTISLHFLGSGLAAWISYRGGDGNDVVLKVYKPGPPVFLPEAVPSLDAEEGKTLIGHITQAISYGGKEDPRFAKISGPDWLRLAEDGTLTGRPTGQYIGPNTFILSVADSQGGDRMEITIPVVARKLVGRWDFSDPDAPGKATLGADIKLEGSVKAVPGVNEQDGAIQVPSGSFFRCAHGIAPNGGGKYVNQYTLVFDIRSPAESATSWIAFFQTNPDNRNDAECFVRNPHRTLGLLATGYSSWKLPQETWTRIAVSVDNGHLYHIYADGKPILRGAVQSRDGNHSLGPEVLFFADNDGEDQAVDVSSIAIYRTALSDAEVAALGAPGHLSEGDPPIPQKP